MSLDLARRAQHEQTKSEILDPTQMSDILATKLGYKEYHHGTAYNGGNSPTITYDTNTGLNIIYGAFIPYQTQDGNWRCRFNITLTGSNSTNHSFTVAGLTTRNIANFHQGYALNGGGATTTASVSPNSGSFNATFGSSVSSVRCMGELVLDSKPTWAY